MHDQVEMVPKYINCEAVWVFSTQEPMSKRSSEWVGKFSLVYEVLGLVEARRISEFNIPFAMLPIYFERRHTHLSKQFDESGIFPVACVPSK